MRAREAKDFVVQQTAEQAQLDSVPLSDLEKRMMYFTETSEMPEDPIQLNDQFEAQWTPTNMKRKSLALCTLRIPGSRKKTQKAPGGGTMPSKNSVKATITS